MKWIKQIKNLIVAHKKNIFFVWCFFVLFFILLFPYEDVVKKMVLKMAASSKMPVHLQYESSSVGIFPPRLIFKNVQIETPWMPDLITSDLFTLQPSYLALLALKPGIHIQFVKGQSHLHLTARGRPSSKKKNPISLQVQSKYLELSHLKFISPLFHNAKGVMEFFLTLKLNPSLQTPPQGLIQVQAQNIEIQPYSLSTKIGSLNLPLLKWSHLKGKAQISGGRLNCENLVIGAPKDPFYLQSDGILNFEWGRFSKSIGHYNFNLDLSISAELKQQFFFIELFLSNVEEKLSKDRFRYQAKIKGKSLYPPKIEKIEK